MKEFSLARIMGYPTLPIFIDHIDQFHNHIKSNQAKEVLVFMDFYLHIPLISKHDLMPDVYSDTDTGLTLLAKLGNLKLLATIIAKFNKVNKFSPSFYCHQAAKEVAKLPDLTIKSKMCVELLNSQLLLEKIELPICSICNQQINHPRTLSSCVHIFCSACIHKRLITHRLCPICGLEIKLGDYDGRLLFYNHSFNLPQYLRRNFIRDDHTARNEALNMLHILGLATKIPKIVLDQKDGCLLNLKFNENRFALLLVYQEKKRNFNMYSILLEATEAKPVPSEQFWNIIEELLSYRFSSRADGFFGNIHIVRLKTGYFVAFVRSISIFSGSGSIRNHTVCYTSPIVSLYRHLKHKYPKCDSSIPFSCGLEVEKFTNPISFPTSVSLTEDDKAHITKIMDQIRLKQPSWIINYYIASQTMVICTPINHQWKRENKYLNILAFGIELDETKNIILVSRHYICISFFWYNDELTREVDSLISDHLHKLGKLTDDLVLETKPKSE